MVIKLLLLLLGVAVPTTLAAPQPLFQAPIDIILNSLLNKISDDPITLNNPLVLDGDQPGVMVIHLQMNDVSITGLGDFASEGSTATLHEEPDAIFVKIHSPQVTLNTGHYTLDGKIVDHIDLVGAGSGWITVEHMVVMIEGKGNITNTTGGVTAVFTSAKIDLEMWRWTVNLEGIMPGTDLGTVFNEFFTMCGPEIFDTIENNLNKSGKVLDFLNSLFPPDAGSKSSEA